MSGNNMGGATVAKKAGRPKRLSERGIQVRIETDLVRMARLISTSRGENMTAFLSEILRPVIQREYAKVMREFEKEEGER